VVEPHDHYVHNCLLVFQIHFLQSLFYVSSIRVQKIKSFLHLFF
jgi:hypothetical protein